MKSSFHDEETQQFRVLYDQYYEAVRNFIYYKSGDINLSEDLTQEAFMILWRKRETIDATKVKSYLYTIAHNLFLNEIKHQKVVLKFNQQPTSTVSNESPQYQMEEEEFRAQLLKAISDLPEKNRVVFLMNRMEKMTYKDIADSLGISIKAVEKRMHKALQELRNLSPKI
ncbi:MAG: RNA polymerase sigma-70 factor [Bacteroidia bacterium]|nr:RNA polymerase sigma-70 factor [Bacteroidia bacterium]